MTADGAVQGIKARLSNKRDDSIINAKAVIIATGGSSYPATGSTGDGYRLAEAMGHKIIAIRPALVGLETAGSIAARLQGLSLRNVTAKLIINKRKKTELFGEMLFTHFGLSGPIILSLSLEAIDALDAGKSVQVSIDLKPALDDAKLEARLLRDFRDQGKKQFKSILKGLLPRKLIPVCLEEMGIDPDLPGHQVESAPRKRLQSWLKDFRFEVTGYRSFSEAIVTAGGVHTREIDPQTMESKLIKGLYFAGEVIDINGDTGGYNLQAAFSTGRLAGISAAERKDK
jgi:predicted Rossmann fold flavoprotein